MTGKSKIEWTERTWNPVRGCSMQSHGCKNCYAMRQAHRFSGEGQPYEGLTKLTKRGPVWTGKVRTVPELLNRPSAWRKSSTVFVNSMSDLFHPKVPDRFIAKVWNEMAVCRGKHIFQILTKNPERMLEWVSRCKKSEAGWITHNGRDPRGFGDGDGEIVGYPEYVDDGHEYSEKYKRIIAKTITNDHWPLPNIWLGVSAENQEQADKRIPVLLKTPAAVRFVSAEPLLSRIEFKAGGTTTRAAYDWFCPPGIDWVIVGGESGPGARPMNPGWVRSIQRQCKSAGIPFFFKQWGEWAPFSHELKPGFNKFAWVSENGRCELTDNYLSVPKVVTQSDLMARLGKKAAGRRIDGHEYSEYPA